MAIVMTSLPLARVFQCLFPFALVSASLRLTEIRQLSRREPQGNWSPGELTYRLQNCLIGHKHKSIRHFRYERGTGAEIRRAIASGIVTRDARVRYWFIFYPVPRPVPGVFSKVNSAQFTLFLKSGKYGEKIKSIKKKWRITMAPEDFHHKKKRFSAG